MTQTPTTTTTPGAEAVAERLLTDVVAFSEIVSTVNFPCSNCACW